MKIYTKNGDNGKTSLFGGRRVSKSIVRLEVIGCIDELNALLGLINAKTKELPEIQRIQSELLQIGADIATPYSVRSSFQKSIQRLSSKEVQVLEKEIDKFEKELPKLTHFILPGGHEIASILQFARAVARRAERNAVRLEKGAKVNPNVLKYLNRLSDWLFVAARWINFKTKTEEIIWK